MTLLPFILLLRRGWVRCLIIHSITFSSLSSKKVKLTGVVTEDKMTGETYVTHMTVMEDTMGAKQPEPEQTNSTSTTQGKEFDH